MAIQLPCTHIAFIQRGVVHQLIFPLSCFTSNPQCLLISSTQDSRTGMSCTLLHLQLPVILFFWYFRTDLISCWISLDSSFHMQTPSTQCHSPELSQTPPEETYETSPALNCWWNSLKAAKFFALLHHLLSLLWKKRKSLRGWGGQRRWKYWGRRRNKKERLPREPKWKYKTR